jgi:hypothetical protein
MEGSDMQITQTISQTFWLEKKVMRHLIIKPLSLCDKDSHRGIKENNQLITNNEGGW